MSDHTHPTSDPKIAAAAGSAVPWWGSFYGTSEVPRFFKEIANVDVTEFEVVSLTANELIR